MILPRIGIGVDVHAYAPVDSARVLHLAGLEWPGERALEGHSDADVAAHAAADALLSAAGIGDLGSNFGTSEPAWAGAAGAVKTSSDMPLSLARRLNSTTAGAVSLCSGSRSSERPRGTCCSCFISSTPRVSAKPSGASFDLQVTLRALRGDGLTILKVTISSGGIIIRPIGEPPSSP